MQTDSIRKQVGHISIAVVITTIFTILWFQLFPDTGLTAILALSNLALLIGFVFLGLYAERPRRLHDEQHVIDEDLSNPADLWIWPIAKDEVGTTPVDLKSFDLDDSKQMMAWLELLMIEEDLTLRGNGELSWVQSHYNNIERSSISTADKVDLVLFSTLIWLLGIIALIWIGSNS